MALYWVKVRGAGLAKNSAAQCSIAIPATFDLLLLQVLVGRRLKAEKRQSSRLLMGTGAGWRFCGTSVFFQYLFDFSVLLLFFFWTSIWCGEYCLRDQAIYYAVLVYCTFVLSEGYKAGMFECRRQIIHCLWDYVGDRTDLLKQRSDEHFADFLCRFVGALYMQRGVLKQYSIYMFMIGTCFWQHPDIYIVIINLLLISIRRNSPSETS